MRRPALSREIIRSCTAPMMRVVAAIIEHAGTRTVTPTDAPQARVPGPDPLRLLLLGSGPAVGWGVTRHSLALPGALARAISADVDRGVTVDVVADPRMTAANARHALRGRNLDHYDSVVVTLGVNDALRLTSGKQWATEMRALYDLLVASTNPHTRIFFVGVHPIRRIPGYDSLIGAIAAHHASRLNSITATVCGSSYLPPLSAPSRRRGVQDRHRTAGQYTRWASELVGSIVQTFTSGQGYSRPESTTQLSLRRRAIGALNLGNAAHDPVLRQVAALALKAFDAQSALVTILNDSGPHYVVIAGEGLPQTESQGSFTDMTIRTGRLLLVPDARRDVYFRYHPLVAGSPHIRFLAGHPIEAPTGERIGALNVLDAAPRPTPDEAEIRFLQELAVRAGQRLWHLRT
jgi:lysophospholipase L1-like esterase